MLPAEFPSERLPAPPSSGTRPGYRLAMELVSQSRFEEGALILRQDVEMNPHDPHAWLNLGAALRLAGNLKESAEVLSKALSLRPRWPLALFNLGTALLESGELEGAAAAFHDAVAIQPDWCYSYGGLGMALLAKRELDEAKASFRKALELDPDFHEATHCLGRAHWACGEPDATITTYQQGQRSRPDCKECHFALSLALLTSGRYTEGWAEYEWRWDRTGNPSPIPDLHGPTWDGSPLNGETVVVWAEQGLGDVLQFVRFTTMVHERGGTVVLFSRPQLDRLLSSCHGISRVVSDPQELGDYDYQIPIAGLPNALGITLDDLPAADVPYLSVPACRAAGPLGPRKGNELRIGVVWGVEAGHPNCDQRSCPLPAFGALEQVPDVELYSLQFGSRSADLLQPDSPRMADLSGVLGDFANTAALAGGLDLVITVDTSMAHLAGAIGKRVWTLLPWDCDWRWLRGREDSPWYPTMRLFRQKEEGCWDSVIREVVSALHEVQKDRRRAFRV